VNGGVSHSAHEPAQWPFSLSLSLPPSLWAGFAVPYTMPWVRDRKLAASFPRCALILRELRVSGRSLAGSLERSVKIYIAKEAPEAVEHTCVRLCLA
jgi:hypothetical protein